MNLYRLTQLLSASVLLATGLHLSTSETTFISAAVGADLNDALASSETFDRARLVILAPNGPVLAELQISVSGLPYRQWVGRFLAQQLDLDNSGSLDHSELDLLTPQLLQMLNAANADQVMSLARADNETSVGTAEQALLTEQFSTWMRERLPKSFFISVLPQNSDDAVRLTSLLDSDQDGTVSNRELVAAEETLRFRDLDDDQTFSISELMPYRDPRTQGVSLTPEAANLPFVEVTDQSSANRAAQKILSRYGHQSLVETAVLRANEELTVPVNNQWNQEQLIDWLLSHQPHLQIEFRLSDKANRSRVAVSISSQATSFCQQADQQPGSCRLTVDDMPVSLIARGGGSNNRAYLRGFLGQNFLMNDGDRNQYLDESEFAAMSGVLAQAGANGDFHAVDRDQNGMITREEVFSFANRESISSASRIEVTVKQDGKSIFGLLDTNGDRRISKRELLQAPNALSEMDRTGDGRYADEELGVEYSLTIGLGRAEVRRNSVLAMNSMQTMSSRSLDAILPGVSGLTGPEWFRRMDRNQDGDVSRREFLGTVSMFAEIDQNADELIDESEASALSANE